MRRFAVHQVTVAVLLLLRGALASVPVAGGAGTGIYFSSKTADVASFEWKNPTTDLLTYELWYRVVDMHRLVVPLSYTVWDTTGDTPYINSEEVSVILNEPAFWRLFRGDLIVTCNGAAGCPKLPNDSWVHFAFVFNGQPDRGNIKFFRDGVQVVCPLPHPSNSSPRGGVRPFQPSATCKRTPSCHNMSAHISF
jgi:hypothetical protein